MLHNVIGKNEDETCLKLHKILKQICDIPFRAGVNRKSQFAYKLMYCTVMIQYHITQLCSV